MQKFIHLKQIILLLDLMLPAVWCGAKNVQYGLEGPSNVPIKVSILNTNHHEKTHTNSRPFDGGSFCERPKLYV